MRKSLFTSWAGRFQNGRSLSHSRPQIVGKRLWTVLALLAPALVLMLLFKAHPILAALSASTGLYNTLGERVGDVGFENFALLVFDPSFGDSLRLTLLFSFVKVPIQLALGLGLAMLLRGQGQIPRLARSLIIVPSFVAMPVVAIVFAYLFDQNIGIVNAALGLVGIARVGWLVEPIWTQVVMVSLSVWRDAGLTMLIFLAGLTSLPNDLFESARVEGAGPLQVFRHLTLPLLQRSTQFATVFVTLLSFQIVVPVWIMTKGGPNRATDVVSYSIYEQTFQFFDWGVASAMAVVLLVVIAVIIGLEMWWLRPKWQY